MPNAFRPEHWFWRRSRVGDLSKRKQPNPVRINATWRSEAMVVFAWAVGRTQLPPVSVECEPSDVANGMGFLDERQHTPLQDPQLRSCTEIEAWADTYLTLHWRLRRFSLEPVSIDFVAYVNACTWGPLRLDRL